MGSKLTKEEFILRFNNLYGKCNLILDMNTYINLSTKMLIIDKEFGEWWVTPKNLLSKRRKCRKREDAERVGKKIISVSEIKKRITKMWGDTVTLEENTYININTKCKFIDKDYGEFFMTPNHVTNGSGHKKRGIRKNSENRTSSINKIKKQIYKIHGDIIKIKEETYTNTNTNAIFIHKKYGEWSATPNNVIHKKSSHPAQTLEKTQKTNLKKYGVKYATQNKEVQLKIQKGCWATVELTHWKTKEPVLCRGSYEFAVISELNRRKLDYTWQIRIELLKDMIYYCDLFLVDDKKYVEIKGIFKSERNKMKWEMFHKRYKNSELWQEDKVKLFTNKSIYRIKKEFNYALSLKN